MPTLPSDLKAFESQDTLKFALFPICSLTFLSLSMGNFYLIVVISAQFNLPEGFWMRHWAELTNFEGEDTRSCHLAPMVGACRSEVSAISGVKASPAGTDMLSSFAHD
jgi:hypothetical protein